MKTERLYWEDPLGRDFEARILEVGGSGGRLGVFLDRTLFHPEGGGQPADRGFLTLLSDEAVVAFGRNDLEIDDVIEEGERILHLIGGEVSAERLPHGLPKAPEGGWPVRGKIDWDYRFDLMQQHTGHTSLRAFELLDAHGSSTWQRLRASTSTCPLSEEQGTGSGTSQPLVFRDLP